MILPLIALFFVALIVLAAVADRRARARRRAIGEDRFTDAHDATEGATRAITRARRAAQVNGGYGVPGSGIGSGA